MITSLSSLLAILTVLVACCTSLSPLAQERSSGDVHVEVAGHPDEGVPVTNLVNMGALPVTVDVARLDGGTARVDRDLAGDAAVRLPAYRKGSTMPRAVVRVRHRANAEDPLAPGKRAFTFGASFNLDRVSRGSSVDNGNNIMQRGMWADAAQYKLQVDSDRVSCRVMGSAGAVSVKSSVPVQPGRWYDVECARSGSSVALSVTEHLSGGKTRTSTSIGRGAIGTLLWQKASTPLSIGGKLAANGQVVKASTDQFNGVISDPVLDISR